MKKHFSLVLFMLLLTSCNKIENNQTLKKDDLNYIKSLKLLQEGETITKFYSEYKIKVAGNFFTDLRVATYWIDERNSQKNEIEFAYYKDIFKVDTVYNPGVTYSPYILITRVNGSKFKVSVNGEKEEIRQFFEGVYMNWKKNRQ